MPWRERPTSSSAAAGPKSAPAVRISDARRPQAERQRARAGPQDRASVARSKPAWRDGPDSGGEGDPRPRRVWAPPGAKRCIPKVKVVHTGRLWIRARRRAAEGATGRIGLRLAGGPARDPVATVDGGVRRLRSRGRLYESSGHEGVAPTSRVGAHPSRCRDGLVGSLARTAR